MPKNSLKKKREASEHDTRRLVSPAKRYRRKGSAALGLAAACAKRKIDLGISVVLIS